jgi:putative ABC transport system ATP-binding protein
MERTLFKFIWKYSTRQQLMLLLVTLLSFPFLYASLELPKRIINDAIGSETQNVVIWGYSFTQVEYLFLLCFAFLAAVLASGLMKMRINTMKGVLSERLLRRFRYQLLNRMLRFPKPYFRSTSQGELVSMVTSEAEPMGGLMGDAVAQPVFQAGQMLTIVTFLFMQSVWFGLAGIALIPLQAWLIPMLQRQINQLNKKRIVQVRHLASEIGETAAGISDLRVNGGWRYRLAEYSDRLGKLFEIRFQIYQKKFFMKFLNNFITQLTPFFFYAVGGYLAIKGEITVGALVAALAAYKDIAAPWKELLTYYNQVQDMSLRWEIVIERFEPRGMIDEDLFDGQPDEIPHLRGAIQIKDVTIRDADGNPVLEDITLDIPQGARVAVQSSSAIERAAFADLLTREVLPVRGSVTIADHPLNSLHQSVLASRIGYAHSRPYLFDGTLGDNLLMSLRRRPMDSEQSGKHDRFWTEALRSGNSTDRIEGDWLDPDVAGLLSSEDIRDWWFKLVEAMGVDDAMVQRSLNAYFSPELHPKLAESIVALRPVIRARLKEAGLDTVIHVFDPESFNPSIPLGGNLLFAAPRMQISQEVLATDRTLITLVEEMGLAEQALEIARGVMQTLHQTFGRDGTDHPLFQRLGIDADTYIRLSHIAQRAEREGTESLTDEEEALLITVPFLLTAEQIGRSFPEAYKNQIVEIRKAKAEQLREAVADLFVAVDEQTYLPRLTALENAIFGRISMTAGAKAEQVEDVVCRVMNENGLRRALAETIYDLPTGLGGSRLPTVIQERAAFSRAAIKRPDILILDKALASHDSKSRAETRRRLRDLLPQTTIIFMEDTFASPDNYDLFIEIKEGRIDGVSQRQQPQINSAAAADLRRKQRLIAGTELFGNLDTRNQRLLAFSAQWYDAAQGTVIFREDERADAIYLCLEGKAEMHWPENDLGARPIASIGPGRVIGDLSIILNEPRQLRLIAVTDTKWLRISAEEFRAVVDSDPAVARSLLKTVASNLAGAAELLRHAKLDHIGNPAKPLEETTEDDLNGQ